MKKIMFIGAGFLLSSAMFISCSLLDSLKKVEENGFICSNYSLPVNSMDKEEVLAMISNYYNKQYKALHDQMSSTRLQLPSSCPQDSRAVFFNLDVLKKLIYFTEKASKNFTALEKDNLGLNIYYASYPEIFNKEKNGISYKDRHTLIFIPSILDTALKMPKDINLFANLSGSTTAPSYIDSVFLNSPKFDLIACLGDNNKTVLGSSSQLNSSNNFTFGSTMVSQNNGTGTPPPPKNTGNVILDLTDPQ